MEQEKKDKLMGNSPEYHKMTNKFFYASLANIPLFGVPAFIALFLGRYLDNRFETGKTIMIILLAVAFVSSWLLVIRNNRKITREFREAKVDLEKKLIAEETE